jgi:2-polyprenyl-6-hydroxyphenyl methylase/3-demethylubiquinone-9 3-methyltransferase
MTARSIEHIKHAIRITEEDIEARGSQKDLAYFREHASRFERAAQRVTELVPKGSRILDIGSHYLHLSTILRSLGYKVVGMDVPAFASDALVRSRARSHGVENHVVLRMEDGNFLPAECASFDAVIFTEIMEHITFNPSIFWRRVYDILKIKGVIYITTPNSLTPWKVLHEIKGMATLRGVGISPLEIFQTVTYGHHWKEYSADEMYEYFQLLSPDFSVNVIHFNYAKRPKPNGIHSPKALIRGIVKGVAAHFAPMREQLEVVVRLESRTRWLIETPNFL